MSSNDLSRTMHVVQDGESDLHVVRAVVPIRLLGLELRGDLPLDLSIA